MTRDERQILRELRCLLEDTGYLRLFSSRFSVKSVTADPWQEVERLRRVGLLGGEARLTNLLTCLEFFLWGDSVSADRLERALGNRLLSGLDQIGFVQRFGDTLRSRYCLLCVLGHPLIVEQPAAISNGRLVSSHTYLSTSSIECAARIIAAQPAGRVLELGCGTGLLSILANRCAAAVTATDIDTAALRVARLNFALNGSRVRTVHSDLFDRLSDVQFDLIIFNPPWRIVPPSVNYPNRVARVGQGVDGLGILRKFLVDSRQYLAPGGSVIFPIEFPGNHRGFRFMDELDQFVSATRCSLLVDRSAEIVVEQQAILSAETCAAWNRERSIRWLTQQFLAQYDELNYDLLFPAMCVVCNDGGARLFDNSRLFREDAA